MNIVFIGGSRKVSRLNDSIRECLQSIIYKKNHIIVGDANGSDKAVQTHLSNTGHRMVTIYCSGNSCRNNVGNWDIKNIPVSRKTKDRVFYAKKDEAMAEDCTAGFMLWDGLSSGTLNNCLNILGLGKPVILYCSLDKSFNKITSMNMLQKLLSNTHSEIWDQWEAKLGIKEKLSGNVPPKQFTFEL